LQVYLYS